MKKKLILLPLLAVLVAGCAGTGIIRDPVTKRYKTERIFKEGFDKVWDAAYGVVFSRWPIRNADKASGTIATDWALGKSDYIYTKGYFSETPEYVRVRYAFNIHVASYGGRGSLVRIKRFEEMITTENVGTMDDPSYLMRWEPVESSTRSEHAFLNEVEAVLTSGPGPHDRLKKILEEVDRFIEGKNYGKAAKYLELKIDLLGDADPLKAELARRLEAVRHLASGKKKEKENEGK